MVLELCGAVDVVIHVLLFALLWGGVWLGFGCPFPLYLLNQQLLFLDVWLRRCRRV